MANFLYRGVVGGGSPETKTVDVVASGSGYTIKIGDLVEVLNGYAVKVADGEGATGKMFALAISDSTETGSVNGTVDIQYAPQGLILEGTATTPKNLSAATLYDKVTIDVSGAVQTVDENDPGSYAVCIYKYPKSDYATTGTIWVTVPWNLN